MNKFLAVVDNSYEFPHEIFAESKELAMKKLLDDVPEQSITGIYTIKEYEHKMSMGSRRGSRTEHGEMMEEPIDFNKLINYATESAVQKDLNINKQPRAINNEIIHIANNTDNIETTPVVNSKQQQSSTFEDNGIKYKISDGIVYKQAWRDLDDNEIEELRIVSISTNRILKSEKNKIQKLDWIQLK